MPTLHRNPCVSAQKDTPETTSSQWQIVAYHVLKASRAQLGQRIGRRVIDYSLLDEPVLLETAL
ncbi:MAG: hypothetical protein VKJ06_08130 [Vampirovibrionales bacterium]|nr:hypothetical protein [Vampirovibrionales bacterium]